MIFRTIQRNAIKDNALSGFYGKLDWPLKKHKTTDKLKV